MARDLERWYSHRASPVTLALGAIIWAAYWATLIAASLTLVK